MNHFLTKIHINKIFHLENVDIVLDPNEKTHLILTGKNGSGKTSLLNALVGFLENIKGDDSLGFLDIEKNLTFWEQELGRRKQNSNAGRSVLEAENMIRNILNNKQQIFGKLVPEFNNLIEISKLLHSGEFIFAFYEATRKTVVAVPKNPDKPNLQRGGKITDSKTSEFLKFLVDLKVQEALARNENAMADANKIKEWFVDFTLLLKNLFDAKDFELKFNYKDYSFKIKQGKKVFGFNELSDGYSAIIDIIADLILKMQHPNSLIRAYEKQGIVLIDEIETHLHLELQKAILPMLTTVFPNIQFIVSTHSPFVLNSLSDAVAYDLEKQQRLEDLTEYSYEALAEGYFNVTTDSNYLQTKLSRFRELARKTERDIAESMELEKLDKEFASLQGVVVPQKVRGEYLQIKQTMK